MFEYNKAFSRNIGWVTDEEQQILRHKRVAIAGAGGVGGVHLLTLARLGIANFNISDFDDFEVHNFNRQSGAFMSTLGEQKVDVMEKMALDINPEATIKSFPDGIFEHNVDEFLEGVDLSKKQKVTHFLHFKKERNRKSFLEKIKTIDFNVDSLNFNKEKDFPYELQMHREDELYPTFMAELTKVLNSFALINKGYYDGWAIKPEDTE